MKISEPQNFLKIALVLAFAITLTGSATAFSGGDGSSGNPYQISTCSELNDLGSQNYIIVNDIDCSGYTWSSIPSDEVENSVLDGQNYTVSNLQFSGSMFSGDLAFNGYTIKNTVFQNLDVNNAQAVFGGSDFNSPFVFKNLEFNGVEFTDSSPDEEGFLAVNMGKDSTYEDIKINDLDVDILGSFSITGGNGGKTGNSVDGLELTNSDIVTDSNLYMVEGETDSTTIEDVNVNNVNFTTGGGSDDYANLRLIVGNELTTSSFKNIDIVTESVPNPNSDIVDTASVDNIYLRNIDISGASATDGLFASIPSIEDVYLADISNTAGSSIFTEISPSTINDVYYDSQNTPFSSTPSGVTGLTTSEMQGSSASSNMNFDYVNIWSTITNPDDYPELQTNIVAPPTIESISNPTDGSSYLQNVENVSFESEVSTVSEESATVNFIVEDPSGTNTTINTFSQGSGSTVIHTYSQTFSDTGSYDFYVNVVTASKDITEYGSSFNIDSYSEPSVDLWLPENNSVYELEWNENGIYDAKYEFNISIDDSVSNADYTISSTSAFCSPDQGSGTASYTDTISSSGTYDHFCNVGDGFSETWSIEVNDGYNTVSSNSFNFDTEVVDIPPQIGNYEVTPSIGNASVGNTFDIAVDGSIGSDPVQKITYSMSVSDTQDPSDIVVSQNDIDFQNSNSWNDQVSGVFEFKQEYQGEDITITATVEDEAGRTDSQSVLDISSAPPNSFILNSPDNNEVFLIAEGDSTTSVGFTYGLDSVNSGTVELIVDGTVEDSFQIGAETSESQTYNMDLSSGSYSWKVKFSDDETGDTYESGSRSFDVSDEPFNLRMVNPSDGSTIDIVGTNSTSIDHSFEIDARATNNDFNYEFELRNSSDSSVVDSRSSGTLNHGTVTHTETVEDLSEGSYEWEVSIYMDETLHEQKTSSYSINENPLHEASIEKPVDNEVINIDANASSRDIESFSSVKTYENAVDLTYKLDGENVHTQSISAGSEETVEFNLSDVSTGDHTLTMDAVDSQDRTVSDSVNFSVEKATVEFRKIEFRPSLDQASVGDEIDIYVEGSGTPSDVDFVELELQSDGETFDTIIIPAEDLKEGSWFITLNNAFTVTKELLDTEISVKGIVQDVQGRVSSYYYYEVLGINRDLKASLTTPERNEPFIQTDGEPDNIPFEGTVTTSRFNATWTLKVVDQDAGNISDVASGSVSADSNVPIEEYVPISEFSNTQFGNYSAHIQVADNDGETYRSNIREFSVENDTGEPVLIFNSPSDGEPFYYGENADDVDIPFRYEVDTGEAGKLNLEVNDVDMGISDGAEVPVGKSSRSDSYTFDNGTYEAVLSFESESYSESKTHTFSVTQKEPTEERAVNLKFPSDGRDLYQNQGNAFTWEVYGLDTGNTTLYIEDSDGNVVDTITDGDYNTRNEPKDFSDKDYPTNLDLGKYTFYAEFDEDGYNQTVKSETREFTVVSFEPPRSTLESPDGENFLDNANIPFKWETETFEEETQVKLMIRKKGEYKAEKYAEFSQSANDVSSYDPKISADQLPSAGTYEWFVRMTIGGGYDIESDVQNFTVEEANPDEPIFNMILPEQDDEYQVPEGNETASVDFEYTTELFTNSDSTVELLVSNREDGLENYNVYATGKQSEGDSVVTYNESVDLSEGAYLWKLRVNYPEDDYISDPVGFTVDDLSTDEKPDSPEPKEEDPKNRHGALGNALMVVAGFLGMTLGGLQTSALMIIGTVLTLFSGVVVYKFTTSEEIGIVAMILTILALVEAGIFAGWVGIIMFLLSAGILVYALNKAHGGD